MQFLSDPTFWQSASDVTFWHIAVFFLLNSAAFLMLVMMIMLVGGLYRWGTDQMPSRDWRQDGYALVWIEGCRSIEKSMIRLMQRIEKTAYFLVSNTSLYMSFEESQAMLTASQNSGVPIQYSGASSWDFASARRRNQQIRKWRKTGEL